MKKYILLGLMCSVALFSSQNVYAKAKMVNVKVINKSSRQLDYVRIVRMGGPNFKLFGIGKDLNSGAEWSGKVKKKKLRIMRIEVEYHRRLKDLNLKYKFGTKGFAKIQARPMNLTNAENLIGISIIVYDDELEISVKVGKE